ncbi:MAG: hypothetical protein JWO36_1449 [Myxococcales bacterium]|nr:hypothetical protein [Myxococcales bacterium]
MAMVAWIGCESPHASDVKASPNGLEILSQGIEPRRVLAYSFHNDQKSILELALDMTLTAGAMGGAVPTIVSAIEIAVEGVLPTGHANVRMTVLDASARDRPDAPSPAASLAAQLAAIKGVTIHATIGPDGKLSNTTLEGDQKRPEAQQQQINSLVASFQQLTMPIPNVPLGAGAMWKSTRPIDQGGLKMSAVNTVALTNIEGTRLTFAVKSELHGADQTVTISGVAIHVEHISGTGEGHLTLELDKLTMTGEIDATFKAEMSAENEKTPMQITTKLVVTPR